MRYQLCVKGECSPAVRAATAAANTKPPITTAHEDNGKYVETLFIMSIEID